MRGAIPFRDVDRVHGTVHRREHAEDKGDRGAQTRAQEREGDERGAADYDRDGRSERVLAERHTRLPVQKRVVECVEERARRRHAEDERLRVPARRTSRRSPHSYRRECHRVDSNTLRRHFTRTERAHLLILNLEKRGPTHASS